MENDDGLPIPILHRTLSRNLHPKLRRQQLQLLDDQELPGTHPMPRAYHGR